MPLPGEYVRFTVIGERSSPAESKGAGVVKSGFELRLDVGCEGGADGIESLVDAAGQCAHASGSTEGDQSDNQSVLDQILTFFAALQVLELHVKLQKDGVHVFSLRRLVSPASGQAPSIKQLVCHSRICHFIYINQSLS